MPLRKVQFAASFLTHPTGAEVGWSGPTRSAADGEFRLEPTTTTTAGRLEGGPFC